MVESEDLTIFDIKIGNPWSILPIKNWKYAQDLDEVHLSDRNLSLLENFHQFPNLEVIWLSNNKVSLQPHPIDRRRILSASNFSDHCMFTIAYSSKTWTASAQTSESKRCTARVTNSRISRASSVSISCASSSSGTISCVFWTTSLSSFRSSHSLSSWTFSAIRWPRSLTIG